MCRGKALNENQKATIRAFSRELVPERVIASNIEKSKTAVRNFIWAQTNPVPKKKGGRPKIVPDTTVRAILRHTSTGNYTAHQLRDLLNLPVTVRRFQQLLLNNDNLAYKKMKCAPMMTDKHKEDRVKCAVDHVSCTLSDWRQGVFSDEKRFCLDAPDGFAS